MNRALSFDSYNREKLKNEKQQTKKDAISALYPPHILVTTQDRTFEAIKQLGSGNFADVLLVKENGKELAIKLFRNERSEEECYKLWKEESDMMRAIGYFKHPNLLAFHSVGQLESETARYRKNFIMMDYAGLSLFDIMEATKARNTHLEQFAFRISTIRDAGSQIASGMKALDDKKILHLDLKPENVFLKNPKFVVNYVVEEGICYVEISDTSVVVGDFGCSRVSLVNETNELAQTQNYRAPEVFIGLPLTKTVDVWSFGCIIYEMYTFELLFYGNNNLSDSEAVQFDMMQRTVRQEPTPRMMREASERSTELSVRDYNSVYMIEEITSKPELVMPLYKNKRPGDIAACDLFGTLEKILTFDPYCRPSFAEILEFPFFKLK
ncbi:hypothetical protein CRE_01893 [Caenorhabditis remanei]|uniref:Uncharacterized protein n=1 Tax=Caenorhabditis remanei TaxID=31234 RepID=E3LG44_CAERE|nr:hypothetical protein CRE_01893 [Caenorhabditis remanei]